MWSKHAWSTIGSAIEDWGKTLRLAAILAIMLAIPAIVAAAAVVVCTNVVASEVQTVLPRVAPTSVYSAGCSFSHGCGSMSDTAKCTDTVFVVGERPPPVLPGPR